MLVVVNPERSKCSRRRYGCTEATDLRSEEARGDARHHHKRGEAVEVRHAPADCVAGDFGIVPFNREGDRRIAQHAEIVAVMRVLPNVLASQYEILPERLLEAGVEFISETRREGC